MTRGKRGHNLPTMPDPLVSVLLLTWNSRDVVGEAIASALAQTHPNVEVIVLDNHSQDGTAEEVVRRFPGRVQVVRAERNTGFAEGCNRLLLLARGEFLVLLNPDARLDPTYLQRALPAFEDPRVGIVAGLLMRPDGTLVDSSGQFLARSRKVIDRGFGRPFDPHRDTQSPVLSACGAAALYRRKMVEDLSDSGAFFDPSYFAFYEDLEVGWRAWRAGWRAVCVPAARGVHQRAGGAERGWGLAFRRTDEILSHIVVNRWLMMVRHDRFWSLVRDLPWILGWDLVFLGVLLLRRPRVLRRIWDRRHTLAVAWRCRARDRRRWGQFGLWKETVPPRGIWKAEAPEARG